MLCAHVAWSKLSPGVFARVKGFRCDSSRRIQSDLELSFALSFSSEAASRETRWRSGPAPRCPRDRVVRAWISIFTTKESFKRIIDSLDFGRRGSPSKRRDAVSLAASSTRTTTSSRHIHFLCVSVLPLVGFALLGAMVGLFLGMTSVDSVKSDAAQAQPYVVPPPEVFVGLAAGLAIGAIVEGLLGVMLARRLSWRMG